MDADEQVGRDVAAEDFLADRLENPLVGLENACEAVFSGIKVICEDDDADLVFAMVIVALKITILSCMAHGC